MLYWQQADGLTRMVATSIS